MKTQIKTYTQADSIGSSSRAKWARRRIRRAAQVAAGTRRAQNKAAFEPSLNAEGAR